jgi:hypothetical protein
MRGTTTGYAPVNYVSGTPYITTDVTVDFANMVSNSDNYRTTTQYYLLGFYK